MKNIASNGILLRKGIFLSAIFFLATMVACKDDGQLVPSFNSSLLNLNDTIIAVNSSTAMGDSVRTDRVSRSLFGKLNDATFGKSTAEFYSQLYMPSSALNTSGIDESDVDSVVLYLAYENAYGYAGIQEIMAYELSEGLDSSEYYSTSSAAFIDPALGSGMINVNPADTINDSFYVARIPIDPELGRRIVREQIFDDQQSWLAFFKGIRVAPGAVDPAQGEGSILYFNLLNSASKLTVYYRGADGNTDKFSFVVQSASQRFANFDHDLSGTALLTDIDQTTGQYNYLTSMAGSYIKINLNGLEELSAALGPVAVNKAELVLPFEEPFISEYSVPAKTVLIVKDDISDEWVLPIDWFKNGSDFFGGDLDPVKKEYRFNIPSTVHEMLNLGDYERSLFLSVSGNSVTANRLALSSGNSANPGRKIYVHLTYTKSR
ncbi:MAG: DUF4270 family protein [Vicingaceae bacterium]